MAVSRIFWSKNLKPVVVSLKPGVVARVGGALRSGLRSGPRAQPGVRPPIPPETPGFNETTTGFKLLVQKTRETANFRPSFTETVHKKK